MQRVSFKMQLRRGFAAEYKQRHDHLWPEIKVLFRDFGIQDYSIFLDPETHILFALLHIKDPARLAELPEQPIIKKWWLYMSDIMETNADHSPRVVSLDEVFYLP